MVAAPGQTASEPNGASAGRRVSHGPRARVDEVSEQIPPFRFWLRADAFAERPYAVRFETEGAIGVLRISSQGMLIDGPAARRGYEERLSAEQLRESRFLLVWNTRHDRETFLLGRLDDEHLASLDRTYWYELVPVRVGEESFLAFEPPVPAIELGEGVGEADSGASTIPALEGPREAESGAEALSLEEEWLGGRRDDGGVVDPPPPRFEASELDAGPMDEADVGAPAALVRHLRRQLVRERLRVRELEERVRVLEGRLEGPDGSQEK